MKHLSSLHWLLMMWYDVAIRKGVEGGGMGQGREWLYMIWYDVVVRKDVKNVGLEQRMEWV